MPQHHQVPARGRSSALVAPPNNVLFIIVIIVLCGLEKRVLGEGQPLPMCCNAHVGSGPCTARSAHHSFHTVGKEREAEKGVGCGVVWCAARAALESMIINSNPKRLAARWQSLAVPTPPVHAQQQFKCIRAVASTRAAHQRPAHVSHATSTPHLWHQNHVQFHTTSICVIIFVRMHRLGWIAGR